MQTNLNKVAKYGQGEDKRSTESITEENKRWDKVEGRHEPRVESILAFYYICLFLHVKSNMKKFHNKNK